MTIQTIHQCLFAFIRDIFFYSWEKPLYHVGIQYGHEFKSQLLHFRFSPLLMYLGKLPRIVQVVRAVHHHLRTSWFLASAWPRLAIE